MIQDEETGGPAFPVDRLAVNKEFGSSGMTLRDYIAIEAMTALLNIHGDVSRIADSDGMVRLHIRAYEHADMMLSARTK